MSGKKALVLNDFNLPVPVNINITHVNSASSVNEHIDADAQILTTNLLMLMQAYPNLNSLSEICELSDQVMKVLHKRRELCLKPTSKAETEDSEINITPVK